jgi:tetratricopeptide (TPR) repeat protein
LPKGEDLGLRWQRSPRWSAATFATQRRFQASLRELSERLVQPHLDETEKISILRRLGDMLFADSAYDEAAVRYEQLAVLCSQKAGTDKNNASVMTVDLHQSAYALAQYSRCLLHTKQYLGALKEAKQGQQVSFFDYTGDVRYQIYFAEVIGVATVMITGQSNTLTNDYLSKFVSFIDKNDIKSGRPDEMALVFAEIGDCYQLSGQWEQSIALYQKSVDCWQPLINPGAYDRTKRYRTPPADYFEFERKHPLEATEIAKQAMNDRVAASFAAHGDFAAYNCAVAQTKMGVAQARLGQNATAQASFSKALDLLQQWGGENSLDRVKVLVRMSDIEWSCHDYLNACANRIQALKIVRKLQSTAH